jgi:hypothetical protein
VIKELAPIVGGRGGGKADMAEGGGNQPEKLGAALEQSYSVVEANAESELSRVSIQGCKATPELFSALHGFLFVS